MIDACLPLNHSSRAVFKQVLNVGGRPRGEFSEFAPGVHCNLFMVPNMSGEPNDIDGKFSLEVNDTFRAAAIVKAVSDIARSAPGSTTWIRII